MRVRAVVCFSCTRGLLKKKPIEMEYVETVEAKGLEDHLIGTFQCPICKTIVGFIHQPVRIFKDGSVVGRAVEDFKL